MTWPKNGVLLDVSVSQKSRLYSFIGLQLNKNGKKSEKSRQTFYLICFSKDTALLYNFSCKIYQNVNNYLNHNADVNV
jgi:hypothetical protein